MALRRESEDLQSLYRTPLFRSDSRVGSHWQVAQELSDHEVRWKDGAVDTAMFKGELPRLRLYALRYGPEVEIRPKPFRDFALVHMTLRGAAEFESDGQRVAIGQGGAAILAPRKDIRLRWLPGTEQLILKVPHEVLDQARSETGITREIAPAALVPAPLAFQWSSLVRAALAVPRLQDEQHLHGPWVHGLERTIAHFVLAHQEPVPATRARPVHQEPAAGDDPALRQLQAMLRFMQQHLAAPLTLDDLSQAAAMSPRTLHDACLRHWGASPMRLLRNVRLDAVHDRLLREPKANITRVALDCGFSHAGRFAGYYEERFGELPRQTQAKARG